MIEKFIYQPVSPFFINQRFGEDNACISTLDNKTVITKPVGASCPVNFRSLYANTNGHNGLDLRAARWQPVYVAHDEVRVLQDYSGYDVKINIDKEYDGSGTLYLVSLYKENN